MLVGYSDDDRISDHPILTPHQFVGEAPRPFVARDSRTILLRRPPRSSQQRRGGNPGIYAEGSRHPSLPFPGADALTLRLHTYFARETRHRLHPRFAQEHWHQRRLPCEAWCDDRVAFWLHSPKGAGRNIRKGCNCVGTGPLRGALTGNRATAISYRSVVAPGILRISGAIHSRKKFDARYKQQGISENLKIVRLRTCGRVLDRPGKGAGGLVSRPLYGAGLVVGQSILPKTRTSLSRSQ